MWNPAGMCVNAEQGRLRISLGAVGDRTQAEFLPVLPLDTPVRWRGSCGTLTAMKPHQSSVSAEGKDLHKSRSPAMRDACDACDACICSVFRDLESQLTVFLGARIAENFLPSELPSKSVAWGRVVKIMA
jgi:hypothetical protein